MTCKTKYKKRWSCDFMTYQDFLLLKDESFPSTKLITNSFANKITREYVTWVGAIA